MSTSSPTAVNSRPPVRRRQADDRISVPGIGKKRLWALLAVIVWCVIPHGLAAETLKIASPIRGSWEGAIPELGRQAGIFRKYDLDLDILYTQGGGETLQVVMSGSVDIGLSAGVLGSLGAYGKGAPLRIVGGAPPGREKRFGGSPPSRRCSRCARSTVRALPIPPPAHPPISRCCGSSANMASRPNPSRPETSRAPSPR